MDDLPINYHNFELDNLDNFRKYTLQNKLDFQYYLRTHIMPLFSKNGFSLSKDKKRIIADDGSEFELSYYITKDYSYDIDITKFLIDAD